MVTYAGIPTWFIGTELGEEDAATLKLLEEEINEMLEFRCKLAIDAWNDETWSLDVELAISRELAMTLTRQQETM